MKSNVLWFDKKIVFIITFTMLIGLNCNLGFAQEDLGPDLEHATIYSTETDLNFYRLPGPSDFIRQHEIPSRIYFLNPYENFPYYYKAQIHAHSKRSDGSLKPKKVLELYKEKGYHFVSLTDHDKRDKKFLGITIGTEDLPCWQIYKDPNVTGITYVPGREGGKGHRTHFLEVHLTQDNPCAPQGDFSLETRNAWVEYGGGFTAAPHALSSSHLWNENELFDTLWLRGIEIKNDTSYISLWDKLLRADRVRWGICVDDFHKKTSINRGWIVVNSRINYANRYDMANNLRNGNFYAVYAPNQYDGTYLLPAYSRIRANPFMRRIDVEFQGANKIVFFGRDGQLAEFAGFDENDASVTHKASHTCNGSEGYVRIELHNSNGIKALSQPIFVYGSSVEDCLPLNYQVARVEQKDIGGNTVYRIVDNLQTLLVFKTRAAADTALSIIRHYRLDRTCFIGRPGDNMIYYTSGGDSPSGPCPNEDCIDFNPNNLEVKLVSNPHLPYQVQTWKIVEGDNWLLDFDDSEIQARRALEIIKRHGFKKRCFVERPLKDDFGMRYFRN